MKWYWKVRIYRPDGVYAICELETARDLREIDTRQDFYKELTGCKMVLEGMSEIPLSATPIKEAFLKLWGVEGEKP